MGSVPVSTNTLQAEPQTFIFNDDMTKIRQAELVILKEEQKFGIHMRDPDGKIAPRLQALTRIAAVELKRDDRRPIEEPAVTQTHAPHAEKSDIGIKKNVWVPEKAKLGSEEIQRTAALREKYITDVDTTIKPKTRGEGKGGGILAPLELRGVESHPRRPLKTNLAADIEFRRHREMSTLSKKLEEIRILKEQIKVEKLKELQEKQLQSSRFGVVADIISNQNANSPSKKVGNLKNILTRSKTSSQLPTRRSPQSSPSPTMRKQLTRQKTDSSLIQPNQGGQTSPVGNIRKTRESLSAGALSRPTSGKSMVEKLRKNVSSGHMPPTSPLASPTPSRKSRRYDKDDDESSADESVATSVSANSRSTKGAKVGNHSEQESEIGSDSYSDTGSRGNTRSGRKSSVLKPKSKSSRMSKRVKSKRKKADDIEPTEADFDEETRKQLEVMDKEIELTSHHLSRAIAKEEKIATFKVNERNQKNNEKSRQIERKRRLLTEDEAKRKGPPPEEPANIYDFYSIVAQKAIRGWLARCWIKWYKDVSCKARLKLQAAMRGFLGRVRVRRIRVQYIAARTIQRNFRGWSTRVSIDNCATITYAWII